MAVGKRRTEEAWLRLRQSIAPPASATNAAGHADSGISATIGRLVLSLNAPGLPTLSMPDISINAGPRESVSSTVYSNPYAVFAALAGFQFNVTFGGLASASELSNANTTVCPAKDSEDNTRVFRRFYRTDK
jgi:hypothetical protein